MNGFSKKTKLVSLILKSAITNRSRIAVILIIIAGISLSACGRKADPIYTPGYTNSIYYFQLDRL